MNNTSEINYMHWFFKKKKNCLSEQCEWIKIHLHCWRDAAWCSREKQVGPAFDFHAFQTHNLVGPMNRNLRFFLTKRCWICVLSKTQTQQRRQTRSKKKFPRVLFFFFWMPCICWDRNPKPVFRILIELIFRIFIVIK